MTMLLHLYMMLDTNSLRQNRISDHSLHCVLGGRRRWECIVASLRIQTKSFGRRIVTIVTVFFHFATLMKIHPGAKL